MNKAIKQLTAAGQALYGAEWQSPLARDLEVGGRTMRFWAAGTRMVPDTAMLRLPAILRNAARDRRAAAQALERLADTMDPDGLEATAGQLAGELATRIEGKLKAGQRIT